MLNEKRIVTRITPDDDVGPRLRQDPRVPERNCTQIGIKINEVNGFFHTHDRARVSFPSSSLTTTTTTSVQHTLSSNSKESRVTVREYARWKGAARSFFESNDCETAHRRAIYTIYSIREGTLRSRETDFRW